ncbi:MAG: hypothetical protein A2Y38_23425 [Spirochaetes bacterium GWB1_59_5]|nr:MAG: hypothetical protein A2Y38_23425 [Spirochaetes bacterium GWB1_59_5]
MRRNLVVLLVLTLFAAPAGAREPLLRARGALDEQIKRLNDLLDDPDDLPLDAARYRSNLRRAGLVRGSDDPQAMLALAEELGPSTDVLQRFVEESQRTARTKVVWTMLLTGGVAVLLGAGIRRLRRPATGGR